MGRLPDHNDIEYIASFSRNRGALIKEMEEFARINSVPILDETSSRFLEILVNIHKPKLVLEIGTAIGYSSLLIAENLPRDGKIDTIEIDKNMYQRACEYMFRTKNKSKINIIFDDAVKYISDTKEKYDLIFLDCDKEVYPLLFDKIVTRLNTGGLFVADNLLWHGYAAGEEVPAKEESSTRAIRAFNEMFFHNEKLRSELLPIGDGIGLAIKLA